MMKMMKSISFLGLLVLGSAALHGQTQPPTTGTQYWSTDSNLDCSGGQGQPFNYTITLASGGTGYVCEATGNFIWLAAGKGYVTSIRVAGPASQAGVTASGAIGVDYSFYDLSGKNLSLDTTSPNGAASGNDVNFVLKANQPAEVNLLGAPGDGPSYTNSQITGSVYVVLYCADAITCNTALPQLIYSAPPTISLSVPISWDGNQWTQWSTQGIDDGGAHQMSLVIFNIPAPSAPSTVATIYTVRVFDSTGAQVGLGTTPAIAEYGTYGDLLSNIVKSKLPSGVFKVLVDGGSNYSQVLALQANGRAVATLQVAYDNTPGGSSSVATSALRPSVKRARAPLRVRSK